MSPMRSRKQRSYLWAKHPDVAAKFEKDTKKGKKLPKRAPKKKGK